MIKSITIILLIAFINAQAQHTDTYLKLVNGLEKVEVIKDTTYHKNGIVKSIREISKYEYLDKYYTVQSGKSVSYFKNGQIESEIIQDEYGNYLVNKYYNKNGDIETEWIALEIDTNYDSLKEYLRSEKSGNFKRIIKHYRYSRKLKKSYVYKEVYRNLNNNIPSGKVDYLNLDGTIKRTRFIGPWKN